MKYGITEAELLKLKAENLILTEAEVTVGEGENKKTYYALYKDPKFLHLRAFKDVSKDDEITAAENLYTNCVLAADKEITASDIMKLQVVKAISQRMNQMDGISKNL